MIDEMWTDSAVINVGTNCLFALLLQFRVGSRQRRALPRRRRRPQTRRGRRSRTEEGRGRKTVRIRALGRRPPEKRTPLTSQT